MDERKKNSRFPMNMFSSKCKNPRKSSLAILVYKIPSYWLTRDNAPTFSLSYCLTHMVAFRWKQTPLSEEEG